MQNVRDTFIKYIAASLPQQRICYLQKNADDPKAAELQVNAINIMFTADNPRVLIGSVVANFDIAFTNEYDAIAACSQLFTVISANPMTLIMQYPDDATQSPSPVGGNVYWNPNLCQFQRVADQLNFRWSASVRLYYHFTPVPGLVDPGF